MQATGLIDARERNERSDAAMRPANKPNEPQQTVGSSRERSSAARMYDKREWNKRNTDVIADCECESGSPKTLRTVCARPHVPKIWARLFGCNGGTRRQQPKVSTLVAK